MSRTSHPSAIHHVEFNPMKSVPRRGFGRRWYQRRPCGVGRVEDMRVLLVESGIALPECERVGLRAWLEEGDLQGPLADRVVLAHELVQAALAENAVAVLVDVHAV
jgi:hypothetical protein